MSGLQQPYQKKLISSLLNANESHPYIAGQTWSSNGVNHIPSIREAGHSEETSYAQIRPPPSHQCTMKDEW
jgi:hypothetical protein